MEQSGLHAFRHLRNLKPGNYCFMVMASSPSGNFDKDNVRTLYILVKPPFWQTWWAYIIYFVLLLIILYMCWNIAMMKIRVRDKKTMNVWRSRSKKNCIRPNYNSSPMLRMN